MLFNPRNYAWNSDPCNVHWSEDARLKQLQEEKRSVDPLQEEKRQARIDEVIVAAGEKMAASEGPPHVLHILVMAAPGRRC